MTEWCMTHPWMTFWIAITALCAINNIGQAVFGRRCDK
jgi:hypothetical protein